MTRLRISLLRGPYLGPFEACNYEPLLDRFELKAYILPQNKFALDGCRLPVHVCRFPDAWLFGGRSVINAWRTRVCGEHYPMPGLDRIVRNSDIVHTFEAWYTYTQQAARACGRYGVPLVITHWDTLPYAENTRPSMLREIRASYHEAARILAATDSARRVLLSEGIPEKKIVVQGMGIDSDRFSPGSRDTELMRRINIEPDDFVFMFVGRLVPEKGVRELAQAFQQLIAQSSPAKVKLLLIGSGPLEEWLRNFLKSGGLEEKIIIASSVPYSEIHLWYRLANVFVLPCIPSRSVEEQFGYALLEAMSTGLAVITTTTGGIPDVVDETALLIPPADVVELHTAMAGLRTDAAQRRRLGDLGRQRVVRGFSTRVVAESLSCIYQELCSS